MLTNTLIYAGLLPLVIAVLVALAARRLNAAPKTACMCGVALGYVAAQFGLKSQAGIGLAVRSFIQPPEAADWLPLIALVAGAISLMLMRGWRLAMLLAAAFALAVPMRLLAGHARIAREWSLYERAAYLSLLAAAVAVVWLLLAADDEEQPASGRLACVVIVAVGIAIVLTLSGVLVYGQLSAALAAALTGAALACFFLPLPPGEGRGEGARPLGATAGLPSSVPVAPDSTPPNARGSHHLASGLRATGSASANPPDTKRPSKRRSIRGLPGAAGIIACLLVGLIILGHFYAELSATNAALLVAALVAASTPVPKRLAHHPAWLRIGTRALLCLTPLAIGILSLLRETSYY